MTEEEQKKADKLEYLNKKYSQFAHPKKEILIGLDIAMGNVSEATKKANVSRRSFYNYYNDDADFKAAADDIDEQSLDFAESLLKKSMQNGSDTAIIFYLKTRGKKRGYVERSELTGKDGEAIQIHEEVVHVHSSVPLAESEDDIQE